VLLIPRFHRAALAGMMVISLTFPFFVHAAECNAESSQRRVSLLELYTSEGCSSCPPADRLLSQIVSNETYSKYVIPISLHVDYWDYIGWKDRFAQARFTARQREQNTLAHSSTIYTPQAMLNGRDFRSWSNSTSLEEAIAHINNSKPLADIKLLTGPLMNESFNVSLSVKTASPEITNLYLVLYENELTTQVKAGENEGVRLHHDRVVRQWYGPYPVRNASSLRPWQQKVLLNVDWKKRDMGIVSFVQDVSSGEVLQAMTAKLCDSVINQP
jgi:hypothetical protein